MSSIERLVNSVLWVAQHCETARQYLMNASAEIAGSRDGMEFATLSSRDELAIGAVTGLSTAHEQLAAAAGHAVGAQDLLNAYIVVIGGSPGLRNPPVAPSPESPARAAWDTANTRERRLGQDPATGRFRPSETSTARLVESVRDTVLERFPESSGPDWITAGGHTYDAVGNFAASHFDRQWERLKAQIVKHLVKADYVPVDVSQFTPDQIARVGEFIGPLGPRVFLVGD